MKFIFLYRPVPDAETPHPEVLGTVEVDVPATLAAHNPAYVEAHVFDNLDTESNPYSYEFRVLRPPTLEGRIRDALGPWRRFLLEPAAYRENMKNPY